MMSPEMFFAVCFIFLFLAFAAGLVIGARFVAGSMLRQIERGLIESGDDVYTVTKKRKPR